MSEIRKSVQDAAYTAVGVGVLGAQQAAELSQQAVDTAKQQVSGARATAKRQSGDAKVAAKQQAGDAKDRVEVLVQDVRELIEPVVTKISDTPRADRGRRVGSRGAGGRALPGQGRRGRDHGHRQGPHAARQGEGARREEARRLTHCPDRAPNSSSRSPRDPRPGASSRIGGSSVSRMLTALAGGVGAARFLAGLVDVVDPADVTVIVNTADDDEFHGLWVSPDLDSVTYRLAGASNPETGWGLADETFHAVDALARYGADTWFRLGDRDLATHLYRTERRRDGATLTSEMTAEIAAAWGLRTRLLPMTDDHVATRITAVDDGQQRRARDAGVVRAPPSRAAGGRRALRGCRVGEPGARRARRDRRRPRRWSCARATR